MCSSGQTRKDGRDYYVRQFHDMKGTVETEGMSPATFAEYVSACAVLLARAHSQSANASILRGYAGASDAVHCAVAECRTPTPTSRSMIFTNCARRPRPVTSR